MFENRFIYLVLVITVLVVTACAPQAAGYLAFDLAPILFVASGCWFR